MLGPEIVPGIRNARDLPGLRADSGQVRPLAEVAAVGCERQVVAIVGAAVLLRGDMPQLAMLLAQAAVFALLASPAAHQIPRWRIYLIELSNQGADGLST